MYIKKNIFILKILIIIVIFNFSIQLPADVNKNKAYSSFLNKVIVKIANVRYDPDLKSKIIGRLKENLLVEVIDITNDWAKISLKGFYYRKDRVNRPWGYIHKSLIKTTNMKSDKILGIGSVKIISHRVNIRENSSAKSKIIGSSRKNVIFSVLKRNKNWITIIIPEIKNNKVRTGYIYAPLTKNYKLKPFTENKNIHIENTNNNIISGDISYDLSLQEGRTYVFKGKVKKLKDVKLTIESGAIIDLTNCQFISEDKLSIKGSTKNPIIINTNSKKNEKKYAEIKIDKILLDNCLINGKLKIISKTKNSSIKIFDSKIIGNIEILSFKDIELKRNNITNSFKGISFINSKNILINDSLFLNNNTALSFINSKNIRIKFNTFYNNTSTLITDIQTDLSDNYWHNETIEKILSSLHTEKTITIEPRLLYPSENSPSQMYEHTLYPEETNTDNMIELELFFNKDMDINSIPVLKINSKKHKNLELLNIYEHEWISPRSWFARLKLPKGIKPGNYKIIYSNIESTKSTSPVIIKSPEISVLHPTLINIKSFINNNQKHIAINFSGDKIYNILLYRQTEKQGYKLYRKWKYNKDLKTLNFPIEFKESENWVEFEAFAVNKDKEILAKSQFIRIKAN